MAHYAFINEDNSVVEVIGGQNENETVQGVSDWESHYGKIRGLRCVRTSYNDNIRFHYAGVGYSYDATLDAFIPPRPYPSWTLNEGTANWEPPTPRPDGDYVWDEKKTQWREAE
jgi:hypothetical protein